MADLNLKLVIGGSNEGAIRAIRQVVNEVQRVAPAFREADAAGALAKTGAGVSVLTDQMAQLKRTAAGFLGVGFLAGLAIEAARAADEMKGVDARLRLGVRNWQEYGEAVAGVRRIAFESGTALVANVTLLNRIAEPIRELGGAERDALATVQAVNNALRITNATSAEAASATLQFAQAIGSGVLRGEELNAVLESAPRLARAIADGLGVTVGQLKELGAQGALTSAQVYQALRTQQAQLAEEAARMPVTLGQSWTNATEGLKTYVSELDKGSGATGALASAINTVAQNIPAIVDGMVNVAVAAGVAFGARLTKTIADRVVAMKLETAANREAAAAAAQKAEVDLAVATAVSRKAAAELAAIQVIDSYTLATNLAATAEARRAAAAKSVAANQALQAATTAASAASVAQAAASAGLLTRALSGAGVAARGVMAFFGGPLGLLITGITAAALAWDFFRDKAKAAGEEAQVPVKTLLKNFTDFAGKAGPNELEEQLVTLRGRAAELRDQLLDPGFRKSKPGEAARQDLELLYKEIDRADKRLKTFNSERPREKGQLGLDKLRLSPGGLIDVETEKSLKAFETLYADFVAKATTDSGKLKVSALEARAALEKLFAAAKTPADFNGVIDRVSAAVRADPGSAALKSTLENAIEARSQAELKALDGMVNGLRARQQRTQSLFAQSASIALGQFSQALALSKVAAELAQDTAGLARIDIRSRNAEIEASVRGAALQVAAIEQVAARKRALASEGATAAKTTADAEIAAAAKARDANIAAFEAEVAAGKRTAGQLADYRAAWEKVYQEMIGPASAARVQAETNAARQIRQVDADSARERAKIAEDLYKTLQSKAADALNQYKQYAQQVISLDKSIQANRLDTAAAISALQRTGLDPKAQVQSLRDELAQVQAATAAAATPDQALELLNRQKSLAQQIGGASGEGLDKKALIAEGIGELERIGAEADAILQAQRETAQAAADTQLASYREMVAAMNQLAQQVTALNEQAAIKLKPEIDQAALDGAIAAVKQAFAGLTVPVRVQAVGLPSGDQGPVVEEVTTARARGGPLPGYAPHDTADNMLYWGTPGEWVIQRKAARYYGSAFLAALNAMRLPKFATGGEIGGSVIDRLRMPSLPEAYAAPAGVSSRNLTLVIGGERFGVAAGDDVLDRLQRYVSREALRKGGRA